MSQPTTDPLVLYTIIEALGLIGNTSAYEGITGFLPSARGKVRRIFLHALVRIGERCGIDARNEKIQTDDLIDALQDDDVEIQTSAVKGLAAHDDVKSTTALLVAVARSEALDSVLMPVLEHRSGTMSMIVENLEAGRIRPTKEIIALMGRLVSRIQYPNIPEEYIKEGGHLLQRAIDAVKACWSEAAAETRAAAIDTLFRLDGDRAVEFLDAIANEPDPWNRMHVIELLAPLDDARIPGFIARFLNDDDEMVCDLAASILESRSASAEPSLERS